MDRLCAQTILCRSSRPDTWFAESHPATPTKDTTKRSDRTAGNSVRPDTWFAESHPVTATPVAKKEERRIATRPDSWFHESHPVSPSPSEAHDNEPLTVIPSPWIYPRKQQLLDSGTEVWLGGNSPTSPVRRPQRIGTQSSSSPYSRCRPDPIKIQGLDSSPIKTSPFL